MARGRPVALNCAQEEEPDRKEEEMKNKKFFTVPYDARNSSEMRYVRRRCGGIVAFGRWMALLGMLYEQDGGIDLSDDVMFAVIKDELEFRKDEEFEEFIGALAKVGWVEPGPWQSRRHLISQGVVGQITFKKTQGDSGRKGGEAAQKSKAKT